MTDNRGTFKLNTFTTGDGVMPGRYRITVVKLSAIEHEKIDPKNRQQIVHRQLLVNAKPKDLSAEDKAKYRQIKSRKHLLPAIYADPQKTPLNCTVPLDGKLPLPLESGAGSANEADSATKPKTGK
jgi:hypothetical protein